MAIRSFRDLRVWQAAMLLVEGVYRAAARLPHSESFGLRAQVRRCAVSIPSNIAEGHARGSTREFLRFLSVALGSAGELQTQLELAERLGYLSPAEIRPLMDQANEITKMLHGLRASLRRRTRHLCHQPLLPLTPDP